MTTTKTIATDGWLSHEKPQTASKPSKVDQVDIATLTLAGRRVTIDVVNSILGGEISDAIDGSSTLSFTMHDPERKLLRSKLFNDRVTARLDNVRYVLVKVSRNGDDLALTFEDETVDRLRRITDPRKISRNKSTRAQFILSQVKEANMKGLAAIEAIIPELNDVQPIKSSVERKPTTMKREDKDPGFDSKAKFTVKGQPATTEQIEIANRMLDVARSHKAPFAVMVMTIMAAIQESSMRNLTYGHSSSVGVLQLLDIWLGGSTSESGGRRDVELVTKMFLTTGFTGKGGALTQYAKTPNADYGDMIHNVQGNAAGGGDYRPWKSEAEKIVKLYNGGDGTYNDVAQETSAKARYEFSRGNPQDREKESAWASIRRLADEVGWRAFVSRNRFYYFSDDRLMRQMPAFRVDDSTTEVQVEDFDIDMGKSVDTLTLSTRAEKWGLEIGEVVVIEDYGPADGRFLVSAVQRDLFSFRTRVELRRPQQKLPEPAPEQETSIAGLSSTSGTSVTGFDGEIPAGTHRTKMGVAPVASNYPTPGPHGAARNAFGDTNAADIMVPIGTKVVAVADGVISRIHDTGNYSPNANPNGIHVYLNIPGNRFFYTHMFKIFVKVGQHVKAGQVIGTTGAANSVPHLHFEVENGSIKDWV